MIFNLATLHLGDVLMAMPAMRAGDSVVARSRHRVPGLDVEWLDRGQGLHPRLGDMHNTDAWLVSAAREPARHHLLPPMERTLTVIAPCVAAAAKQWHGWVDLGRRLRGAVWLGATEARDTWMATLNRAQTVICPDTGTGHMADALGVPRVIALYRADNFTANAPYWNRSHCIVRDRVDQITVEDVLEKVNG